MALPALSKVLAVLCFACQGTSSLAHIPNDLISHDPRLLLSQIQAMSKFPFSSIKLDDNMRSRDELHNLEYDRSAKQPQPSEHDVRDMALFDIQPTFVRRFKFVAMVGFASTVVMCWQNTLATFSFALQNGGTGGYFFTYLYGMLAFGLTYLSLAELSSS